MAIALKPGDAIQSGRVFRRIQPYRSRFGAGRPKIGAFRPPDGDNGELSLIWEGRASQEAVLAALMNNWPDFGLCAADIEAIRVEVGDRVRFIYDPDPEDMVLGHAHVTVPHCDEAVQTILLRHAKVIKPPEGPQIV